MKKKLLKKMYAEFEAKEKARKQRKKDMKKCLKIQEKLGVVNKCEIKHFLYRLEEFEKKSRDEIVKEITKSLQKNKTFAQKVEDQERWRESGEL